MSEEPTLYPNKSFVYEINIFDLSKRMLNEWDSPEAESTRKILKESCRGFLWDMKEFHIYHKKHGIYEGLADNLCALQEKIDEQAFWMKLYCLFYEVMIEDEKYVHLLTEDEKRITRWKSRDDWRWLSNWPNALVFSFVNNCIIVILHGEGYSDELQEMFNSVAEWLKTTSYLTARGCGSSKIPKEFAPAFSELADDDFQDINFWFDLYCLLRLELKPGVAHFNSLED